MIKTGEKEDKRVDYLEVAGGTLITSSLSLLGLVLAHQTLGTLQTPRHLCS